MTFSSVNFVVISLSSRFCKKAKGILKSVRLSPKRLDKI